MVQAESLANEQSTHNIFMRLNKRYEINFLLCFNSGDSCIWLTEAVEWLVGTRR